MQQPQGPCSEPGRCRQSSSTHLAPRTDSLGAITKRKGCNWIGLGRTASKLCKTTTTKKSHNTHEFLPANRRNRSTSLLGPRSQKAPSCLIRNFFICVTWRQCYSERREKEHALPCDPLYPHIYIISSSEILGCQSNVYVLWLTPKISAPHFCE